MSAVFDALIGVANRTGRPVAELLRHHFLEAVVRRLGAGPEAELVLRGSMITRLWAAPFPRVAQDLDFLGTFPHSVEGTAGRFLPTLAAEHPDGVRFDVPRSTAKDIWEGSEFPGVRLTLFADVFGEQHVTTVDVGFGDPLVPPPAVAEYPLLGGGEARVWAVHPATLIGWKLHGLAEWGHARWRPKDLLDLWLLLGGRPHPPTPFRSALASSAAAASAGDEGREGGADQSPSPLGGGVGEGSSSPSLLAHAIRVAFVSRHYDPGVARRTLEDPFWETFAARARWNRFREQQQDVPVPESITAVRAEVAARLAPALALLPN